MNRAIIPPIGKIIYCLVDDPEDAPNPGEPPPAKKKLLSPTEMMAEHTAKRKGKFLAELQDSGDIRAACEVAAAPVAVIERWLDEDTDFKIAYARAQKLAVGLIEREIHRRGVIGLRKYKFTGKGEPVYWYPPEGHEDHQIEEFKDEFTGEVERRQKQVHYYEYVYSDALLMFFAKGAAPEKYGDKTAVQHSGEIKLYAFDPASVGSRSSAEFPVLSAGGERLEADPVERPGDSVLWPSENREIEGVFREDPSSLHDVSGVPGLNAEADEALAGPVDPTDL